MTEYLSCVQRLNEMDTRFAIAFEALETISSGAECSACSCSCHRVAGKVILELQESDAGQPVKKDE